jgi:hypothetical protein
MPVLIGIITAVIGAFFYAQRARSAAYIARDLYDMVGDAALAVRRFGFKRQTNIHPVDATDDINVLIAALGTAFMRLKGMMMKEDVDHIAAAFERELGLSVSEARDMTTYSDWMVNQCGTENAAFTRVVKRLYRLNGTNGFSSVMAMLAAMSGPNLTQQQREALDEVAVLYRVR